MNWGSGAALGVLIIGCYNQQSREWVLRQQLRSLAPRSLLCRHCVFIRARLKCRCLSVARVVPPTPLFQYHTEQSADFLNGAVFTFCQGTDPELQLVIEARRDRGEPQWM